jgi:N,N-dimethylformamidase
MHSVDPERLDLVRAFHANPFGPHLPDLLELLKILRWDPPSNRYIAVHPDPARPLLIAKQTGKRGAPLLLVDGEAYGDIGRAWCAVFRKRWEAKTGYRLVRNDDGSFTAAPADVGKDEKLTELPKVNLPLAGYADEFTVRAGDTISFKVSSELDGDFEASLVRIRCGDATPHGAGYKETEVQAPFAGSHPARLQPVTTGSFIEIPDSETWQLRSFTLRAWVWPTTPGRVSQHILGTWNDATGRGYALILDESGAPTLVLGDGARRSVTSTNTPLRPREWCLLVASLDSESGAVTLLQRPKLLYGRKDPVARSNAATDVQPAPGGVFRIAAWNDSNAPARSAGGFYNGKIDSPTLAARAIDDAEAERATATCEPLDFGEDTLARWDFSRDIPTTRIVDMSGNGNHGETVNLPARAMMGVAWDGSEYNWTHAPHHYGAIHFHDDDLYDCGWETDFRFTVPQDLASGIYAARLLQRDHEAYVPFVVSPPIGKPTADLALLLPTASYWAYANRLYNLEWDELEQVGGLFAVADNTVLYLFQKPCFGPSLYDHHTDGSGVCYSSRLRPMLDIRPKQMLWQFPADTHITDWLEAKGIGYDVITEDDLNRYGVELLAPYRCVVTGTHPEYPSKAMMDAYDQYKAQGGRFIYAGGNGFYWRTSYHPELPGVIEVRRAEDGIRTWAAEGGEYYTSFTGELGGMWRRMGRAPQSVAGTGMTSQGFDRATYYERTPQSEDPRAAFIFEGVRADERIGDFGIVGGGAAGWEIDRADPSLGTPPHALVVATASDFSANYHWMKEELSHTHSAITGTNCPWVRSDMVFYETPKGGAVFAASSISWAGALAHNDYDNNVSRITENVVRRFLDAAPFD